MDVVGILRSHEEFVKAKFGVARIGVFGSFARGEEKPDSDVDVLVEFRADSVTFDNYMDLKFYLEDLLGRRVDLVTPQALKPQIKDNILKDTVYV